MMTSKQRAELRSAANTLDTTLIVGKGGVTEAVIAEANILLDSHELVKGKVLETAMLAPQEALDALCAATGAEPIQVVGTKFVFYKKSTKEKQVKKPVSKAKTNPVRQGAQARRKRAKEERERRNKFFHDAAVQAAIARRKEQNER